LVWLKWQTSDAVIWCLEFRRVLFGAVGRRRTAARDHRLGLVDLHRDLGDRAGVAGFVCTRAAYIGAAGFSRQAASGGAALDTTLDRSRVAVITESDGHIRVVPAIDVGCWRSYGSRRIGRGLDRKSVV